ncbi:OLC1v1033116C3 [Oldenlandia corymbosa var. corymbosa]|uniref:Xyloglucan endotransglucosylase/hydrolase n=1 Tax=Oldenlandia corymbosa var. corymbosa TaxID=529605 RepID=A0AAV1CMI9_OLDCO|nr:OLC1v1033116C3 [Oldenlandia corymbosa var. corymbosa]
MMNSSYGGFRNAVIFYYFFSNLFPLQTIMELGPYLIFICIITFGGLILFCLVLILLCCCCLFCCSFYVDNVPIREIKRTASMGGDFPSKPMSVYATIWDGSDWATNGGKYRINYKYAPYTAKFSDFVLHGCAVDPIELSSSQCGGNDVVVPNSDDDSSIPTRITPKQRTKMESFRQKHMQYSYCYDHVRYKVPPSECVIDPKESQRLRKFDPVTFGGVVRRQRGKRHQRSSRPSRGEAASFD